MVVVDHFRGGQVIVQLPPGGEVEANRPTTLSIGVSDVTRQEGLPTDPNPHQILTVSLWVPKINIYISAAVFTDDVAAQEYGKRLMGGTLALNPRFSNFFVYPRPASEEERKLIVTMTESAANPVLTVSLKSTDRINLPLNSLPPANPYYFDRDLSFSLPPLTLEFRGFSKTFEEEVHGRMPAGTEHTMTQKTTNQPAWVKLTIEKWLGKRSPEFVGTLHQKGTREFTLPIT